MRTFLRAGFAALSLVACAAIGPFGEPATSTPPRLLPGDALYAIVYQAGTSWKQGLPMKDQGLRDHFYYWRSLSEQGFVVMAGAMGPDGGLVVLRAASQHDADRIMAEDPAVQAGIFAGTVRPYMPRLGDYIPVLPERP